MSPRLRGVLITATGVLVLSPDSILVRLLDADLATTLFWRGLALAAGMFSFAAMRSGPAAVVRQIRQPVGLGLGVAFALGNTLFVTAITHAGIADTLGSLATASVFAALFSALFLRERVPLRIWAVSVATALGLCLIAIGGAGSGFGRVIGILAAASLGATFVLMRATGERDTLPGLALGGALTALVWMVPAAPLSVDAQGAAAIGGLALVLPLAFGLIGRGPRYLPAAEVSLLMLLETVFGTLWAFLFLGERPTATTSLAIVLILGALALFYARQAQVARRFRDR